MNKLLDILDKDENIVTKVFAILGAILGVIFGMFVTEQANSYIFEVDEDEVTDETTID